MFSSDAVEQSDAVEHDALCSQGHNVVRIHGRKWLGFLLVSISNLSHATGCEPTLGFIVVSTSRHHDGDFTIFAEYCSYLTLIFIHMVNLYYLVDYVFTITDFFSIVKNKNKLLMPRKSKPIP